MTRKTGFQMMLPPATRALVTHHLPIHRRGPRLPRPARRQREPLPPSPGGVGPGPRGAAATGLRPPAPRRRPEHRGVSPARQCLHSLSPTQRRRRRQPQEPRRQPDDTRHPSPGQLQRELSGPRARRRRWRWRCRWRTRTRGADGQRRRRQDAQLQPVELEQGPAAGCRAQSVHPRESQVSGVRG